VSKLLQGLMNGDLVIAVRDLDPHGANVNAGELGVVFHEAEYHEANTGPMVRWFTGGACNVYVGDVKLAPSAPMPLRMDWVP
jgi:hypothetical protein